MATSLVMAFSTVVTLLSFLALPAVEAGRRIESRTLSRTSSGYDCYVRERKNHYSYGVTFKVVVKRKRDCNYMRIAKLFETQVVEKYFTASMEAESCACVHDGETLCRFVPKKFVDAPRCDAISCFMSYSHQMHTAAKRSKKTSKYYSMIHEYNHYEVPRDFAGTEGAPTVMETVKAVADGNKKEEDKILKELAVIGAKLKKAPEVKEEEEKKADEGELDELEADLEIPEESAPNKPNKPLVKVVVMNGQEDETGEIPEPVAVEEGGGTTPVLVPLEELAQKMAEILKGGDKDDSDDPGRMIDEAEEGEAERLAEGYVILAKEAVDEMEEERALPTVPPVGPKPLRGVLTLKPGVATCADVKPPSPDLACGEITHVEECAAAAVMLEGQWKETGSCNKLGKQSFEDLSKSDSRTAFAAHCSARVVDGDRWHVKFNGQHGEHLGKAGPQDKLICGCWATTGKMSKPMGCDPSLKGVQCAGAPITWPTFMHLYAETVMNAVWAKHLGIDFGREMVSEAWNDYKMRCPNGQRAPGMAQPCHSLPPSNVGGVRLGFGADCVVADREGGYVGKTPAYEEGKVLGTECTKFAALAVSERAGRLQDISSGLCLGLHSDENRKLVTMPCAQGGYDMWTHVENREEHPICVANPHNPEEYKTAEGEEYCLGFA